MVDYLLFFVYEKTLQYDQVRLENFRYANRHAAELDEIKRVKRKCMWARFQNTVTCFVDSCYVDGKFDDSMRGYL